jgi:signal transduction histidine kinase
MAMVQGGNDVPRKVQIEELAEATLHYVRQSFPKTILVEELISGGLWPVMAAPGQISQLLLNLCIHARSAMPMGGTLTISIENIVLDDATARAVGGGGMGRYVFVAVTHTGAAMRPEVLDRILETRAMGTAGLDDTNLGLLAVRNIVKRHNGIVQVHTMPDTGASFRVYFPATV